MNNIIYVKSIIITNHENENNIAFKIFYRKYIIKMLYNNHTQYFTIRYNDFIFYI